MRKSTPIIAADQAGYITIPKEKYDLMRKLLAAVKCGEFSGISCDDVDRKNWFDARDEALGLAARTQKGTL